MEVQISEPAMKFLESIIQKDCERCGLLIGKENIILRAVEVENVKKSPVEFELSPVETLRVFEECEKSGLEVVGVWHTHKNFPLPSRKDIEGMKRFPGIWIIKSDTEIKAYYFRDSLKEVKLKII